MLHVCIISTCRDYPTKCFCKTVLNVCVTFIISAYRNTQRVSYFYLFHKLCLHSFIGAPKRTAVVLPMICNIKKASCVSIHATELNEVSQCAADQSIKGHKTEGGGGWGRPRDQQPNRPGQATAARVGAEGPTKGQGETKGRKPRVKGQQKRSDQLPDRHNLFIYFYVLRISQACG